MKESSENQKNLENLTNPLFKLQYMGYFLAGLDTERKDIDYQDFIRLAKFHICEKRGLMLKDRIWDQYSDEEILVEYYAILYRENKNAREDFETILDGYDVEDFDWMDEMVQKNKSAVEKKKKELESLEDEITFDPKEEDNG